MAAGPVVEGTEGAVADTRRPNFALNSYPVRGALTVSRQMSIITVAVEKRWARPIMS